MELDRQKQGTPSKERHSTSKEGIGNTGSSVYEEVMAPRVIDIATLPNKLPIPKPTCDSGKKLSVSALGKGRI